MGSAILVRIQQLAKEISETADEIREKAATLNDETPPRGIQR